MVRAVRGAVNFCEEGVCQLGGCRLGIDWMLGMGKGELGERDVRRLRLRSRRIVGFRSRTCWDWAIERCVGYFSSTCCFVLFRW